MIKISILHGKNHDITASLLNDTLKRGLKNFHGFISNGVSIDCAPIDCNSYGDYRDCMEAIQHSNYVVIIGKKGMIPLKAFCDLMNVQSYMFTNDDDTTTRLNTVCDSIHRLIIRSMLSKCPSGKLDLLYRNLDTMHGTSYDKNRFVIIKWLFIKFVMDSDTWESVINGTPAIFQTVKLSINNGILTIKDTSSGFTYTKDLSSNTNGILGVYLSVFNELSKQLGNESIKNN